MTVIKAAIRQTTWTGDKDSMLDKHEQFARDAKADGAQVICFQELFYGPYFGITEDKKYYSYAIGYEKTHHMNMDHSAWEGFEIDGHVDTVMSRGTVVVDDKAYVGTKGHGRVRQTRSRAVPARVAHGAAREARRRARL